uniref:Immunoglobulin V-set domain-containing protein n=1 Tax=Naja naja TaxID=35670 RepID=A0A8C6V7Z6_NAJNA
LGPKQTFVGSGSAVTVTQTPSFFSESTGQNISFSCSVDDTDYRFYLYRQFPGKTELKVLAYLPPGSKTIEDIPPELKDRLKGEGSKSGNPAKRHMRLDLLKLQASDTGLYLCAAAYTVKEKGTVAGPGCCRP